MTVERWKRRCFLMLTFLVKDCTFYHNTMQTLHNPLGARKARFSQMFPFAKENAQVCLRCWNFFTILWALWKVAGA